MSFLKNKDLSLRVFFIFSLFLIIFASVGILKNTAFGQDDSVCEATADSCVIGPGETVIIEIPQSWIDQDLAYSWKITNINISRPIFIPKKTVGEYISFLMFFQGIGVPIIDDPEIPDPDDGIVARPPIVDQNPLSINTPHSTTYGQTLSLSTSGGSGTGAVSYTVVSGSCTISGSTLTPTGTPSCIIYATKAGDDSYFSIDSPNTTISIAKANQSTPSISSGTCPPSAWGTNCTVSASGGSGTGSYEFNLVSGPCSIHSTTGVITSTGAGDCVVRARRLGDSNYNTSSYSSPLTIPLPKQNQATVTTSGCSETTWGTNCTVSASGGSGTGSYEFNRVSGPCSIHSTTGVVSSTGAGTCVVRARRLSDANYNTSSYSSNRSITLNKQNQSTVTTGGCSSTTWGTNCTVSASGGSGTGSYEFNYVSGPCSIHSTTGVVSSTGAGTCVVRARRLSDANYNTSSYSSNRSITLNKQNQAAPSAPSLSSRTTSSITITSCTGCEYRRGTGAWQDSTTFSGLSSNTSYSFTRRLKETANYNASPVSSVANISTEANNCSHPCGNDDIIFHGTSVTCYQFSSVECGDCPSETRTCNDGTMSGSFTNSSCTEGTCPSTTAWACSSNPCEQQRIVYSCVSNVCSPTTQTRVANSCSNNCPGDQVCCNGSCINDPCQGHNSVTWIYNGQQRTYNTVINNNCNSCWLDRNLGASQRCTSYSLHTCYGDLFQWGRLDDGHQVRTSDIQSTKSSTDVPGHNMYTFCGSWCSTPRDWRIPQNPDLWQGETGINNPCPPGWRVPTFVELNAERLSWSSNNQHGAYSSSLRWPSAGYRFDSDGLIKSTLWVGQVWSSTPTNDAARGIYFNSSNTGTFNNQRATGNSVRCIRDDFSSVYLKYGHTIGGSITGDKIQAISSGGSGIPVTAVPDSGYVFTQWSDGSTENPRTDTNVTSDIDVVAEFGLWTCGMNVTFQYAGNTETYGSVLNPTTGDCWLDRNLGASRVATSRYDTSAHGGWFQWGRCDDGHQAFDFTSGVGAGCAPDFDPQTVSVDQPYGCDGNSGFVLRGAGSPLDWRSPKNDTLWQGINGVNNPCPSGFRIPTADELDAETGSWESRDYNGAFASPLKWTISGKKVCVVSGGILTTGLSQWGEVRAWSSTFDSQATRYLRVGNFYACTSGGNCDNDLGRRTDGMAVRCIRD